MSSSAAIMLTAGRFCAECVSVTARQSVTGRQSGLTSRRAVHLSANRRGEINKHKEQIGYLRQRGIDVLRKPDINKVR